MIKLSQKGAYAIKAIIYIARNSEDLTKISSISLSQKIPESLLRRITADLEKTGILLTIKGRNGGIKIGKNFKDISIYSILESVGEELGVRDCTKGILCDQHDECITTNIYSDIQKSLNGILKLHTLDKIIKK